MSESELIHVCALDPQLDNTLAAQLAEQVAGTVIPSRQLKDGDLVLWASTLEGVSFQRVGKKEPGAISADFTSGAVDHRRKFGGGTGQMIAKAVGIASGIRPQVLDATAGLGKDAFVLATLGCQMTLLERAPVVHALLQNGLARAEHHEEVADVVSRMTLHNANSIEWMTQQAQAGERFQVVYLDPMFPHNDKSALVKKEMRLFRPIVGDDLDAEALFSAACDIAENRVVVKRPRKAPTITAQKPSHQLMGKSSRYDIYAFKKLTPNTEA